MKILLVDDDPTARAILAKIVGTLVDQQTTTACDGAAAWQLLDDPGRSFDLVFLDLSMPELDGYGLLRRMRQSQMLRSTEVIVCTSANDRDSVLKAIQLGARHYIVKPCTAPVVLAKIRQLFPHMTLRDTVTAAA